MNAIDYMEKQERRHRRNLEREKERAAPEEILARIALKIEYYAAAVEALREKGASA